MKLQQRFEESCRQLGIGANDKLLIAVSGGLDSMSLLHMCHVAGYAIEATHANFKLRGNDSDADQALVEKHCKTLNIRCHTKALPIDKSKSKNGLQAEARNLRYAWFEKVMTETGCRYLLTGHHLNDRLETFFIHLLRGSGLKGMASIPQRHDRIMRPLLDFTRDELEAYAKKNRIPWREDLSNQSEAYLRNRIRQSVIPAFEALHPKALVMARKTMNHLGAANAEMEAAAMAFGISELQYISHDMKRLSLKALRQLHEKPTLAKYFFEALGFSPEGAHAVMALAQSPSGKMAEGSSFDAWRDRESIVFAEKENRSPEPVLIEKSSGAIDTPLPITWTTLRDANAAEGQQDESHAVLRHDALQFPLTLRRWQQGDRFVPSGMRGSKKLSDYLTDLKLSVPEKQRVWVLCSGNDICWVVGLRVDERYRWKSPEAAFVANIK